LIGTQLEKAGWRQGTIVRASDNENIFKLLGLDNDPGAILLIASQSCDIANNNIDLDPYIEIFHGTSVDTLDGNSTHSKNPRILHTQVLCRTSDESVSSNLNVELKASNKRFVAKEDLVQLTPDPDRVMESKNFRSFVAWLAARYSRPALPTAFNDRIRNADPRNKLRDKVKKANIELLGIYIELTPDGEIEADNRYAVNLLGLLPADFSGDTTKAENAINAYFETMKQAGMDVMNAAVRTEDKVSVAFLNRFKRFYLDDLSYRDDTPLPPEAIT
jgi:hypothetical protein